MCRIGLFGLPEMLFYPSVNVALPIHYIIIRAQEGQFSQPFMPDLCTKKVKMCTFGYVFKPNSCIIAQNVVTLHRE